ncbi:response regulator [Zooshikella ganghwensis]|uniref:histidine kinase n=1 Tax=Zooshikella ganghwensis TaxID=202772 RepID=A0A4P9VJE7_9GAMM|nr:response regulator [Zooshikella ganghwensis]RDH42726.1 hybrid sensor histidine kinase/response regulator [Zooshikella ganghwensis]
MNSVEQNHANAKNAENDRILLVDDNPANLHVLLQTLNGRGYKLLIAKSGESALKIAQQEKPALILLDIIMPGIDGYEVCQKLKADPLTQDIAIIFLSSLDETKDKVKGLKLGATDFISKPFQSEEVIARVESQLKIHQLEQALAKRNRQLEADNERILASMTEGVIGVDQQAHITFVNYAATQVTGWSEEQLIGKNFHQLLLHSYADMTPCDFSETPLWHVLHHGHPQQVEDSIFWHQQGHCFAVDYSCTPITESGHTTGAVIVFKDITERKRSEQALQQALSELQEQQERLTHVSRLSTMGEMAAGFAHEVNQPLTAISNYSQVCTRILKRDNVDADVLTDALEKIATQARRAGEIIARIRSFVKKPEHCIEQVDCNKLISDVVKLAEVDARNNAIQIHFHPGKNIPPIAADPVQIQQVALNLLRNAMEAMKGLDTQEEGVHISTEKISDQFVKVMVIDRGHGLSPEAAENLFTPFFTTKSTGMGIGLSVCESIMSSHGGKLGFENNPDGGTIFYFTIPISQ